MHVPTLSELTDLSLTDILLVTCLVLGVIYYIYWSHGHGVWQKVGVPGPRPWPIIDHRLELGQGLHVAMEKWFKQYGDTFGVYGVVPHVATLVTKDLSLVKQIMMKDFSNFVDRHLAMETKASIKYGVGSTNGDTWRRQRNLTNTMFRGIKLKMMLPHVCASADTLIQLVTQAAAVGELIPLRPLVTKFSTEVIARVAFGVETHPLSKEETEFAYHCRNYYDRRSKPLQKFLSKACDFIQPLGHVLEFFSLNIDNINPISDEYFVNILKTTIEERKKERNKDEKVPVEARDLLDLFIEAVVDDDDPSLQEPTSKKASLQEVIGTTTTFILGAVESVTVALQYVIYSLACYPHIQEKVIDEMDRVIPEGQPVEYEHLAELKYTEQVINECLRMYPSLASLFRWAKETRTYNDITIPAGTMVHISAAHIMMDSENWPDPETFDPDRFSPEHNATLDPVAFMAFGYGPRNCVGKRLALMELKVATVYLLRRVKFELSDRSTPKKGETPKTINFGLLGRGLDTRFVLEAVLRE